MSNMPVAIKTTPLMDVQMFEQMQRVGKMLALSPLFPEHLRKGPEGTAIANGVLVMNMAYRLNEDPLTIAQNIYFVGGKPGWSASYMIAKANQSGVFKGPIDWAIKGVGDKLSVTAFAILSRTGNKVEVTVDMAMAKAENWTKNAKYRTIPEQMLRYRSATFLIRLYCPEVMVGIPSMAEIENGGEVKDITPVTVKETVIEAVEDADIVEPNKQKATTKPETKPADHVEKPDQAEGDQDPVVASIIKDLREAGGENVGEVLNFYDLQMISLEKSSPEDHARILEIAEEIRGKS